MAHRACLVRPARMVRRERPHLARPMARHAVLSAGYGMGNGRYRSGTGVMAQSARVVGPALVAGRVVAGPAVLPAGYGVRHRWSRSCPGFVAKLAAFVRLAFMVPWHWPCSARTVAAQAVLPSSRGVRNTRDFGSVDCMARRTAWICAPLVILGKLFSPRAVTGQTIDTTHDRVGHVRRLIVIRQWYSQGRGRDEQ